MRTCAVGPHTQTPRSYREGFTLNWLLADHRCGTKSILHNGHSFSCMDDILDDSLSVLAACSLQPAQDFRIYWAAVHLYRSLARRPSFFLPVQCCALALPRLLEPRLSEGSSRRLRPVQVRGTLARTVDCLLVSDDFLLLRREPCRRRRCCCCRRRRFVACLAALGLWIRGMHVG